jgi:hypothetical protein
MTRYSILRVLDGNTVFKILMRGQSNRSIGNFNCFWGGEVGI